jgi:methyl-accepting chemotaxis protein
MTGNVALWKKMVTIGAIAVVALSVLYGAIFWSNGMVNSNIASADERAEQLQVVRGMRTALLNLTLAAMDSIIDKADGKVADERMELINANAKFLSENLPTLAELADTAEEKQLASEVRTGVEGMIKGVQTDLVKLIGESGAEVENIQKEFSKIDDTLDASGGELEEALASLRASLATNVKKTSNATNAASLAVSVRLHVAKIQQCLTEISATRAAEGFDNGFKTAEQHAVAFRKDLAGLTAISATLTAGLDKSFEAFYESGKSMAQKYIVDGPDAGNKNLNNFGKLATTIGSRLDKLLVDMTGAKAQGGGSNAAVELVDAMIQEHLTLMLAAMDSIIDKDEGKIAGERIEDIDKAFALLESNQNKIALLATTAEQKGHMASIRKGIAGLKVGIKTDLVTLIEKSAARLVTIEKAFADTDDVLDANGEAAYEKLAKIETSVEGELTEANEELEAGLSLASVGGLITYLVCGVLLVAVLVLVSRSIIGPINRIIGELTGGAEQTSSASGQVASASQSLAQGASEQAAAIEETSSSIEEMSSMVRQSAGNADQVKTLSGNARQTADKGAEAMNRMSTAIDDIKNSSDETAKIIKTIDEIAFQTNLLALNAAVEAARAGEAGKGFAVVAEEVRNLAQRSAQAAKDTAEMIETSVKNADNGVTISKEVGEALTEIADSSGKVNDLVSDIAAASIEQTQGIEQITQVVTQMDSVTQSNAANAEESASAAEELSAQAEQMQAVVGNLAALIGGSSRGTTGSNQQFQHDTTQVAGGSKASTAPRKAKPSAAKAEKMLPMTENELAEF